MSTGANILNQLATQAQYEVSEPATGTALVVEKNCHFNFSTGASGETNTLSNPFRAGVQIVLNCYSHGGGNRVVTVAGAVNQTGNTVLTFGAARDNCKLESIKTAADTYRWEVTHNDGVALS